MQAASVEGVLSAAKRLVDFVNACPSPFHVVEECRRRLLKAGFSELNEKAAWKLNKGSKYFLTRNKSSIIAFAVGREYESGFTVIGAHTDSPCLKVKPISKQLKSGYLSVGVECYGGGIWATWFDRDLTVAGRAVVKSGETLEHKLLHVRKPILRVPHLCIHYDRDVNTSFGPNKETEVVPILGTVFQEKLCKISPEAPSNEDKDAPKCQADKHHPLLVKLMCDELQCSPDNLLDFELMLADTQPAAIGGVLDEFIFSPRLDNLFNTFCALEALLSSLENEGCLDAEKNIRMIALFDNEEVGSESAQGAGSKLLELVMRRIANELSTCFDRAMANSYLLSADQAHAVHPNYASKHEDNHKPSLHGGPVIKFNSNQKYATTAITASVLRLIGEKCGVPLQDIVVRNDGLCGSTIGPILSAGLGIRTLDIGGPMLAMHSIRETCGTSSVVQMLQLMKTFFEQFPSIDKACRFDYEG